MSAEGQAAEALINITMHGSEYVLRIAGKGAERLAALLMKLVRENPRIMHTREFKKMVKAGQPAKIFSVKSEDFREFMQSCKKYHVTMLVIKEKERDTPMIDVLVYPDHAPTVNRIMERMGYATVDVGNVTEEVREQGENPTERSGSLSESLFGRQSESNGKTSNIDELDLPEQVSNAKSTREKMRRIKTHQAAQVQAVPKQDAPVPPFDQLPQRKG